MLEAAKREADSFTSIISSDSPNSREKGRQGEPAAGPRSTTAHQARFGMVLILDAHTCPRRRDAPRQARGSTL